MTPRTRLRNIISGEPADRTGFWLGNPHADTWPLYHAFFHTQSEEHLRLKLGHYTLDTPGYRTLSMRITRK